MNSSKLFLFIERVVTAKMDIVVDRGHVDLGWSARQMVTATVVDDLSAQLTAELKAEICEVFVQGDFEWHELDEFLTSEPPNTVARLWPEYVRER